jgi:hypothetical protein
LPFFVLDSHRIVAKAAARQTKAEQIQETQTVAISRPAIRFRHCPRTDSTGVSPMNETVFLRLSSFGPKGATRARLFN